MTQDTFDEILGEPFMHDHVVEDISDIATSYLALDQTTPQTVSGGAPIFSGGITTTGNITIDSDTSGVIFGDGQDASVIWDNANSLLATSTGASFGGATAGQSTISSGLVVNDSGGATAADDFRVETDTEANAFVVDASAEEVLANVIFKANSGINTKTSTDDVTDPPTDAELDSAFGTPAALGAGFIGILDDNSADTDVWMCYTSDTSWYYLQGTKAI